MTDSLLAVIEPHVRDGNETALIEWAIGLPADQIPPILLAVIERRKVLQRLEATLGARAQADGLRSYTAPTGEAFSFGTGRKRVVSAPRNLYNALLDTLTSAVGVDISDGRGIHPHLAALRAAFKEQEPKVYLTELDVFLALDKRYAKAAEDYITWEDASKTPRIKEARTR